MRRGKTGAQSDRLVVGGDTCRQVARAFQRVAEIDMELRNPRGVRDGFANQCHGIAVAALVEGNQAEVVARMGPVGIAGCDPQIALPCLFQAAGLVMHDPLFEDSGGIGTHGQGAASA